jgi:hypothetical protein
MLAKKKKSVFGKKIDNILKQREARYVEERNELNDFVASMDFSAKPIPWKAELSNDYKIRYLVQPNTQELKKGAKPKWVSNPVYSRKMQAGIYVRVGKTFRLYKVLHTNPVYLRASNVKSLKHESVSAYNPIQTNKTTEVKVHGYTLRNAIDKIAIPLKVGDRVAIAIRIKYRLKGEDSFSKSGALSYVENFDDMRNYKTPLSELLDGMAARLRGYLAGKELTFTNHKAMEQIFEGLEKKVNTVLAKYGMDYEPDATAHRIGELLLQSAGYGKLSDAKAFDDKKVIKDYEKIMEYYMPQKQLDAKLEKDEIERISLILDYDYIPRKKRK